MGLNASSDVWCQKSDEELHGLKGTIKLVDDILVFAPNLDILKTRINKVLSKCRDNNITISRKKFRIGSKIRFAGFVASDKGVEPDPERVVAISRFPTPKSVSDVRAFLGLANQLGSFLPDLAHATDKLRQLLTKDIAFQWLEEHQSAFQKTKDILTSPKILHFFDRNLESVLMTNA